MRAVKYLIVPRGKSQRKLLRIILELLTTEELLGGRITQGLYDAMCLPISLGTNNK